MSIGSGKEALSITPSLSAVFFACLPKCPLCLAFLLAPLGISLPHQSALLTASSCLLLVVPVGVLWWSECRRGRTGALWIGAIGVLLMAAGRFWAGDTVLVIVGAALMVAAFVWSARSACSHPHCSHSFDTLRQETPHGH